VLEVMRFSWPSPRDMKLSLLRLLRILCILRNSVPARCLATTARASLTNWLAHLRGKQSLDFLIVSARMARSNTVLMS